MPANADDDDDDGAVAQGVRADAGNGSPLQFRQPLSFLVTGDAKTFR